MYEDQSVSVETYLNWLKTIVLWLNNLVHTSQVSTHIIQNEAMMSAHGGVPRKSAQIRQDVGDVSFLSCNKMIFLTR